MYLVNGIRASDCCGLNKECSSKFHIGAQVWQETPKEGLMTYQQKCCEYNYKDEDNSLKTVNHKNHQASSPKFRQLIWVK